MKRIYALKGGRQVLIGEARGIASGEAVVLTGSDYELFMLETPPLSEGELETVLSSRIRTLYPGNSETTIYAALPNADTRKDHIVVVMQKKILENYHNDEKHRPTVISSSILEACLARKGTWIGVFWSSSSVEISLFKDSQLLSFSAHPHSDDIIAIFPRLVEKEMTDAGFLTIAVADDALQEIPALQKVAAESSIPCSIERLDDFINRFDFSRKKLFSGKPPSDRARKFTNRGIFISLVLIICALILYRYGTLREQDMKILTVYYQERKAEITKIAGLKGKLRALEAKASMTSQKKYSAYEVLAAITACLPEDCHIVSLEVSGTAFKFEAEAPNSLSILRSLEASDHLEAIILHSASKDPSGIEHFSISGSYAYAEQ